MVNVESFTDETWNRLSDLIASAFSMGSDRRSKLKQNVTGRLVATIPYSAGCREPERTALSHLAVFVLAQSEAARRVFDHKKEDNYDVLARLAPIAWFEGGDPAVINRGMKALAILLIEGYKRDIASDKAKGWYNPIGENAWDPRKQLEALKASISSGPGNMQLDAVIENALLDGWWFED